MNRAHKVFLIAGVFVLMGSPVAAQVTSLTLNGHQTGAVVPQGEMISWVITLPAGGTSDNEIWVDVNGNGELDEGTDKLFIRFSQVDGGMVEDAPPDMDGEVNGVISTSFPNRLPPGEFLFIAVNNSVGITGSFTVSAMVDPPFTVSGTVGSADVGIDVQWIIVQASADSGGGMPPWMALTGADGTYTINLGAGSDEESPWRVRLFSETLVGPYRPVPVETTLTVTGHHPNVNFTLIRGKVITGTVLDQDNNPVLSANPHLHRYPVEENAPDWAYGDMNPDGSYSLIVIEDGDWVMHFTADGYFDSWWNNASTSQSATVISISEASPDTIAGINGVLQVAALIRGLVEVNGVPTTTGWIRALSTESPYNEIASTGSSNDGGYALTIPPGTYYIEFRVGDLQQTVMYYNNKQTLPADAVTVALGQTVDNINANFIISGIGGGISPPQAFTLFQNYPNPFNPSTTIGYEVPIGSVVRLSVHNLLGQEVAVLVHEQKSPGRYSVPFDASRLPTGMYVYRLSAGGTTMMKKMSFIK